MLQDSQEPRKLYLKLRNSPLWNSYCGAFEQATGMPLVLEVPEVADWTACGGSSNQSKFCRLLNPNNRLTTNCYENQEQLAREASDGLATRKCFAGMCESAIAVRSGSEIVAFLKTGQVFSEVPDADLFDCIVKNLQTDSSSISEDQIVLLQEAYEETQHVPGIRYQGMLLLLAAFASQLSGWAATADLQVTDALPRSVARAREFISQKLDDPLTLGQIATHAGVSPFHLCKLFKEGTGCTVTEYIARLRIEKAKTLLRKPNNRVGEIALEVGFQSLSQFNRSFARFTGETPSEYRRQFAV